MELDDYFIDYDLYMESNNEFLYSEGWQEWLAVVVPFGCAVQGGRTALTIHNLISNSKFIDKLSEIIDRRANKILERNKNLTKKIPSGTWNKIKQYFQSNNWDDLIKLNLPIPLKKNKKLIGKAIRDFLVVFIISNAELKAVKFALYNKEIDETKWFSVPTPKVK